MKPSEWITNHLTRALDSGEEEKGYTAAIKAILAYLDKQWEENRTPADRQRDTNNGV